MFYLKDLSLKWSDELFTDDEFEFDDKKPKIIKFLKNEN